MKYLVIHIRMYISPPKNKQEIPILRKLILHEIACFPIVPYNEQIEQCVYGIP